MGIFIKGKAQIEDSDCFNSFMFIYLMAYYATAFLLVAIFSVVIYNKHIYIYFSKLFPCLNSFLLLSFALAYASSYMTKISSSS